MLRAMKALLVCADCCLLRTSAEADGTLLSVEGGRDDALQAIHSRLGSMAGVVHTRGSGASMSLFSTSHACFFACALDTP